MPYVRIRLEIGRDFTGFRSDGARKFAEIDVERINIVESDGKLRMVLSNQSRQHPGVMDVIYVERKGKRPPGMMFFNEKGDEVGGLVFDGNSGKGQGGSLTFDKFRGDQVRIELKVEPAAIRN